MGARKKRKKPIKAPQTAAPPPPVVEEIEAIEIDLDAADDDAPKYNVSRRAPRIAVDERVQLSGFFGVGDREDRLVDASLHGVFIETADPFEIGDPVVIHIPIEGDRKLRVSGRVRWVTPFGGLKDARAGMGVELVAVGGEAKEALAAMLRRRSR